MNDCWDWDLGCSLSSVGRGRKDYGSTRLSYQAKRSSHLSNSLVETKDKMTTGTSVEVQHDDSNTSDICLVCIHEHLRYQRAISPCGHNDICALCHIRLRRLHEDKRCPICKADNSTLVVDADDVDGSHKTFEDYEIWGNELGSNYTFQEGLGMFFPVQYYKESVLPLFSLQCGVGSCPFKNVEDTFVPVSTTGGDASLTKCSAGKPTEKKRLGGIKALKEHLKLEHGLALCKLCVEGKRDFVSNLPRFTPSQLNNHLVRGDGSKSGFKGHPLCNFCRPKRFYDLTKLHEHLNREHYKCHVCDKQGRPNQFFKDYQQLSIHFDRDHFLCQDPQCIAARFVVFENEIDLRAHELSAHGSSLHNNKKSAKVQVQFRIHRTGYDGSGIEEQQQQPPSEEDFQYGLDGEVFVPEPLQQNEPDISHPFHAARTAELRAQAQAIREQQRLEDEGEAFPALQTTSAQQQQPLVGWNTTSKVRRALSGGSLKVEDFPALSTRGKGSRPNVGNNRITPEHTSGVSASGNGWVNSSSKSIPLKVVPPPTTRSSSSYNTVKATNIRQNNTVVFPTSTAPSLNTENFPSLGRPTTAGTTVGASRYTAAVALGKKIAENRSSAVAGTKPISIPVSSKQHMSVPPNAPSLNSNDFPSLGSPDATANIPRYSSAMALGKKILSDARNTSTQPQSVPVSAGLSSNAINSMSPKEQLDKIKSILGPEGYKSLKNLTKDFVGGDLRPQEFVDMSASLFEFGVKDPNFIAFMPNLINSCPQSVNTARANSYMNTLVQQHVRTAQVQNDPAASAFPVQQPSSRSQYADISASHTKKKSFGSVSSSAWGK